MSDVRRPARAGTQASSQRIDERRRLGFVLRDAERRYTKLFERRAHSLGLTLTQCRALVFLAGNEFATQRELARMIEVEPMSLVRILDHMESQGWVRRLETPGDRRSRRLQITPAAEPVLAQIMDIVTDTRAQALRGFSCPSGEYA
jgi:DNA-binding MarR family transcriptional regulator